MPLGARHLLRSVSGHPGREQEGLSSTSSSGTSSPRHSPALGTEPVFRPVPACGSQRLPVEDGGALVESSHPVSDETSCAFGRLPRKMEPRGVTGSA